MAPSSQRVDDGLVVGVGGEYDDLRAGMRGTYPTGRLDAVDEGHAQVHQHDVRSGPRHDRERLLSVGRPIRPHRRRPSLTAVSPGPRGQRSGRRRPRLSCGHRRGTVQPWSCGSADTCPPSSSIRSRMPRRPRPAPVWLSGLAACLSGQGPFATTSTVALWP